MVVWYIRQLVAIHAPVKGRPSLLCGMVVLVTVSIHAPVKGRPIEKALREVEKQFQSTPP